MNTYMELMFNTFKASILVYDMKHEAEAPQYTTPNITADVVCNQQDGIVALLLSRVTISQRI
jgi:hypothetical protein